MMKGLTVSMVLVLGGLACDLSQYCDANQTYKNNACYEVPEGGMGGASGSDGGSDGGLDGGEGAEAGDGGDDASTGTCAAYEGFGATCTAVSQCTCGLDSCNTFMGANYCTHTHCLADPSICPAGWMCFDVSAFDPVAGSVCLRP